MNEFHQTRRRWPGGPPSERRYRGEEAENRRGSGGSERAGTPDGRGSGSGDHAGHDEHDEHDERRRRGGPRGRGREHRPRGRARRGDVRAAVLLLLKEGPMHGYQLMQGIAERTDNAWRVSPGAVYPTISVLEDQGLVRIEAVGGRKLVTLTDAGAAYLADPATVPADPFAAKADTAGESGLRAGLDRVADAVRTLDRTGTSTQTDAARAVLDRARRELYLILADDPGAAGDPVGG